MAADSETVRVPLTKAQALAAGAVLRGYLSHQRERLGEHADENPNFRSVHGALSAIEEQTGPPPPEPSGRPGPPADDRRPTSST
jgi:hypothetical protein